MGILDILGDVAGQRVLVGVDFNVPLEHGAVAEAIAAAPGTEFAD